MKAYLVIGPESSGTRLFARILIAAGCVGQDTHGQDFDNEILPPPERPIVWRRSVPYGGQMPDVACLVETMRDAGYEPRILILMRDWHAMSRSQVSAGHVHNEEAAVASIVAAYRHIFTDARLLAFMCLSFESITGQPGAINAMLRFLGLGEVDEEELAISPANDKWFQESLEVA